MNKFSSVLMVILALCIFAMLGGVVWLSMMFMDERDALTIKVGALNSRVDAQAIEITTLKTSLTKLIETTQQDDEDSMGMTTVSFGTLEEYVAHARSGNVPALNTKPDGYERYKTGTTDFDFSSTERPIYLLTENPVTNMEQVMVFYLEIVQMEGGNTWHGPYTGTVGRLVQ